MKDGGRWRSFAPRVAFGCLCLCLIAPLARAAAPAMAESLYQEGRNLLAAGRMAEACEKFAESHRLDPATGTLLNLASCNETLGKFATAWAQFRTAQVASRHASRADRAEFAGEHIARLEKLLSYVTVRVPTGAPAQIQISLDGVDLGQAAWNVRLPLDPGSHQIAVARSAADVRSYPFVIQIGDPDVTVDVSESVAPTPSSAGSPDPAAGGQVGRRLWVPYAVLAASAAAIATGGFFGWRAYSKWDDYQTICASVEHCPPGKTDAGDQARTAARASDILMAVGVAGGITAAVLLHLAHRPAPSDRTERAATSDGFGILQPSVTSAGAGLVWSRDW